MSRCLAAGALLAAALLIAGCAGEARAEAPGALTGFRVELDDEERPASGPAGAGPVTWESSWTLSWELVPEAESYAVYYGTNEGNSASEPERLVTVPSLRIQAAAGTSPPERLAQDRAAGLLFTSSQLLVSVAAVSSDGQQSSKSPWFPVGDAPADSRPIGTTQLGAPTPAP